MPENVNDAVNKGLRLLLAAMGRTCFSFRFPRCERLKRARSYLPIPSHPLSNLERLMTKEQVAKAQKLARECETSRFQLGSLSPTLLTLPANPRTLARLESHEMLPTSARANGQG